MNVSRIAPLAALLALAGCAAGQRGTAAPDRPALVVLVSIDQLRADLVQRYDPYFTAGFRRLIDQGAYFNATQHHAASETAAGHATLSTGVVPARSDITANDWSERVGDRWVTVYNVQDTLSPVLGFVGEPGRSPQNLLRTGMADWVSAADPRAKVVSIAGKDRSAILMAGKAHGHIYWYHTGLGRFVTSRFYRDEYPAWVERFNNDVIPTLLDSTWVEESPVAARRLAGADTAKYEADSVRTFFPHNWATEQSGFSNFLAWVAATPYPDRATLGLAKEAIVAEGLGRDGVTDYLAVGFSITDAIGHRFGPTSREQLDNLIRLDKLLGDLFDHLDRTVGRGRWVAALSADHGANTNPEWSLAHGEPGHRTTADERKQMSDAIANAARSAPPGPQQRAAVAAALRALPFIADVYTNEEIASGAPRDSFVTLFRNSYRADRPHSSLGRDYGLEIRAKEWTYVGAATGSGHGGPYFQDRYVPLIFLGGNIQPMKGTALVHTVDLAATMASIAKLPAPNDLDGRPLPVTGTP